MVDSTWSQNRHFNIFLQVSQGTTIYGDFYIKHDLRQFSTGQSSISHLRKPDLNTPTSLSNRPPHYGALLRLNLQVRSSCARQLWNFSSFLTLLSQSAAALNVLQLSEQITRGRPRLAMKPFKLVRNHHGGSGKQVQVAAGAVGVINSLLVKNIYRIFVKRSSSTIL